MTITAPFGRDTSATDRVNYGRLSSGSTLLGEAWYRRLITSRGQLLDDPDYGLPLADMLNSHMTRLEEAAVPSRITGELEKDPRTIRGSIVVDVQKVETGPSLEWLLTIDGRGVDGPVSLSIQVADLTVQLLNIQEAA